MNDENPKISVEYVGDIAVVTPSQDKILEEADIQSLESSMLPLIDNEGVKKMVIDFTEVKFLSSAVLGLLIRVSKKIYEKDGSLRLCCIGDKILEIFRITRLDKVLEIDESRQQALFEIRKASRQ